MSFFKPAVLIAALVLAPAAAGAGFAKVSPEVTDFTAVAPNAEELIDALAQPEPAMRAKSMGASKDVAVVPRRVRLDIPFANRSAELTPAARRQLEELAKALNSPRLAQAKIVLEGHANRTGEAAYNLDLTNRRANAAARFLYDRGVTAARLSAAGFGFERPIPGTDPRDGRNRRVEIVAFP